ncbi:MAG: MBL fold metallo-hydrolase [Stappia sp.]|uniref:MBL fold metallo-hydrolase n=1 Tax=Stappia sp. TaxID=1870903 RepID=UPI000C5F7C94|nr:MBL fold metallo-hydrolase [Stappia sp.]MAA96920.1 MBL fold metallo-hydrolase [Stappia sp.]MBM19596.1 MBL fold metallo-hydrolase [Stappia sp.]MBM21228.1 MBL fold metallo-hydrolase [Stappia sp.]|tara:strand:- start:99 stop:1067 length:969 start_codon:yes stop_codon:yes gene_type:complete
MTDTTVNRRTLLAGAATATLAAPALLSTLGPVRAAAPMMGASAPAFHRIKLGGFEVTTLRDAARAMDGPHPIFGEDQDAGAVAELMRENNLPTDRMVNGFTPVLVNTGSELVLFDTGLGGENGKLAGQLEAAGYSTDQIDTVVITHMHGDHIGGLMKDGAPVFANARYVTGQAEYDFWSSDDRMGTAAERGANLARSNVVPLAEKITFIGDGDAVVSGITGLDTSGHTPGHMSFHLESDGQELMIWGDVANHFAASVQRPEWHVRYDMDKEKAVATRKRIFDMAATDGLAISGYHMPFPAIGYVEKVGEGYRWTPATYQFEL